MARSARSNRSSAVKAAERKNARRLKEVTANVAGDSFAAFAAEHNRRMTDSANRGLRLTDLRYPPHTDR